MKLINEIENKFDDIDGKIDFLIERCKTLQKKNSKLILKIEDLETQLEKKNMTEEKFSEQETLIQLQIDRLLKKLKYFSNETSDNL